MTIFIWSQQVNQKQGWLIIAHTVLFNICHGVYLGIITANIPRKLHEKNVLSISAMKRMKVTPGNKRRQLRSDTH